MDETTNTTPGSSVAPTHPVADSTSQDTRTLVTVLLLIFLFPVGFLVMWFWSKWKVWVKVLVSSPLIFALLAIMGGAVFVALNPEAQIEKARQTGCQTQCADSSDASCVSRCIETGSPKNTTDVGSN